MSKTIILWDIDGTLLLTGGSGKAAFNRIFKELYNEDNIWDDLHPDGKTDTAIIKECYQRRFQKSPTEEEIDRIKEAYIKENKIELKNAPRFHLMPYVEKTLNKLSLNPTIAMGLATGNYREPGFDKLKRGQIDHHFNFGGFACDSEDRLKLTQIALENAIEYIREEPKDVYLIGDTVHDIRCGNEIGATTIAVCTGSTTKEVLKDAGADEVINDLSELTISLN